ncbi:MAG: hypothetical protein CR982_10770 [Candidatus Cloacimonadota bacterium]|nr:MAG: hypothetical protein CR982_10770 [Candidatus Cloacimonadota bacterium]PIE78587.1 MAG: hypothetical protein CSA15_06810 [Candidatus Delongbacteria bacterium]
MKKILTYHKVGISFDSSICWVDHYSFTKHVEFLLSRGFNITTVDRNKSSRDVSIIFDDGYENLYRYREFFLEKDLKVSIYPITGYLGKYDLWDIPLLGVRFKHLTRENIKVLSNDGHLIGSHSHTHKDLSSLPYYQLKEELKISKEIIEDITGKVCKSISLPFGRINKRVYETALEIGYKDIIYLGKKFNFDRCYKSKQVYFFDTTKNLELKLKPSLKGFKFEEAKLDIINYFNRGTILVKKIKSNFNQANDRRK